MAQLIDKSALVEEIKRLSQKAKELYGYSQFNTAYDNVLESINTLEVKEVDLDFTAIAMPSDSSIWVNHDDLPYLEDGDNVEILIIKK
jgi:hypothetical protein